MHPRLLTVLALLTLIVSCRPEPNLPVAPASPVPLPKAPVSSMPVVKTVSEIFYKNPKYPGSKSRHEYDEQKRLVKRHGTSEIDGGSYSGVLNFSYQQREIDCNEWLNRATIAPLRHVLNEQGRIIRTHVIGDWSRYTWNAPEGYKRSIHYMYSTGGELNRAVDSVITDKLRFDENNWSKRVELDTAVIVYDYTWTNGELLRRRAFKDGKMTQDIYYEYADKGTIPAMAISVGFFALQLPAYAHLWIKPISRIVKQVRGYNVGEDGKQYAFELQRANNIKLDKDGYVVEFEDELGKTVCISYNE